MSVLARMLKRPAISAIRLAQAKPIRSAVVQRLTSAVANAAPAINRIQRHQRWLTTTTTTNTASTAADHKPVEGQPPSESDEAVDQITRKFTHSQISEPSIKTGGDYTLPHPIWKKEYLEGVEITRRKPKSAADSIAYWTIQIMRFNFDLMSGYFFLKKTENIWLNRIIFLETVAAVPGSIGATVRHLASLRRLRRDHGMSDIGWCHVTYTSSHSLFMIMIIGWIHTLLEEAENERMHLLTALYVVADFGCLMCVAD